MSTFHSPWAWNSWCRSENEAINQRNLFKGVKMSYKLMCSWRWLQELSHANGRSFYCIIQGGDIPPSKRQWNNCKHWSAVEEITAYCMQSFTSYCPCMLSYRIDDSVVILQDQYSLKHMKTLTEWHLELFAKALRFRNDCNFFKIKLCICLFFCISTMLIHCIILAAISCLYACVIATAAHHFSRWVSWL